MYKIILPNFEGPFDLLLYFIKRDELNIYDIPIARISEEFLKYIKVMQYFDLELAGEFLVMAATLMYIKTQMLLPKPEDEENGEAEDPRTQLVQQLIEYKKFKYASKELSELADDNRYSYYRQLFDEDVKLAANSNGGYYRNTTLFDLLKALKKIIDRNNETQEFQHIVPLITYTVEEKSKLILDAIKLNKRISFFKLVQGEAKISIIVSFLAILELIKKRNIFIIQDVLFDDILICENPEFNLN